MGYIFICCECGKYVYNRVLPNFFMQCSECGSLIFKIEVISGSHSNIRSCKIICIFCNEYMALNYSKVRDPLFRFIQCPQCKRFYFKVEVIKGKGKNIDKCKLNMRTQELY